MQQHKQQNQIDMYRRRMGFSPRQTARLLGHKNVSVLSSYERGGRMPALVNAFRLSIILRVPVEFLFPSLYDALREQIRAEEDRDPQVEQSTLL
jgi:transcriptional regulator with XRE-family HTH domain